MIKIKELKVLVKYIQVQESLVMPYLKILSIIEMANEFASSFHLSVYAYWVSIKPDRLNSDSIKYFSMI